MGEKKKKKAYTATPTATCCTAFATTSSLSSLCLERSLLTGLNAASLVLESDPDRLRTSHRLLIVLCRLLWNHVLDMYHLWYGGSVVLRLLPSGSVISCSDIIDFSHHAADNPCFALF